MCIYESGKVLLVGQSFRQLKHLLAVFDPEPPYVHPEDSFGFEGVAINMCVACSSVLRTAVRPTVMRARLVCDPVASAVLWANNLLIIPDSPAKSP